MGRAKKKPEYDQNRIMEQFQNCIVEAYTSGIADGTGISLRQVSEEFGITLMKTRKILITAGIYHTENSEQINSMRKQGMNIPEIMKATGLVVFLGIVFGSTVFTRTGTIRQYELVPFWSWRDIIRYHDWTLLKENLLNCILLLPAGVLLPIIANHKIKWYQALIVGILVSAIIEFSQLIFMRGLFEWDDMIHNGLGCMIGSMVTNYIMNVWRKNK